MEKARENIPAKHTIIGSSVFHYCYRKLMGKQRRTKGEIWMRCIEGHAPSPGAAEEAAEGVEQDCTAAAHQRY
eukprot:3280-Pelagomonas_calceolata.AAC.1